MGSEATKGGGAPVTRRTKRGGEGAHRRGQQTGRGSGVEERNNV
jgi:hypothetical protein